MWLSANGQPAVQNLIYARYFEFKSDAYFNSVLSVLVEGVVMFFFFVKLPSDPVLTRSYAKQLPITRGYRNKFELFAIYRLNSVNTFVKIGSILSIYSLFW